VLSRFFLKKESVLLADLLASTIWLNFLIYVTEGFFCQYLLADYSASNYWRKNPSVMFRQFTHYITEGKFRQ